MLYCINMVYNLQHINGRGRAFIWLNSLKITKNWYYSYAVLTRRFSVSIEGGFEKIGCVVTDWTGLYLYLGNVW